VGAAQVGQGGAQAGQGLGVLRVGGGGAGEVLRRLGEGPGLGQQGAQQEAGAGIGAASTCR